MLRKHCLTWIIPQSFISFSCSVGQTGLMLHNRICAHLLRSEIQCFPNDIFISYLLSLWVPKSWKNMLERSLLNRQWELRVSFIPPDWLPYVRNTLFLSTLYNQWRKAVSAGSVVLLWVPKALWIIRFPSQVCKTTCSESRSTSNLHSQKHILLLVTFQWHMERQISPVSKTFKSDYTLLS